MPWAAGTYTKGNAGTGGWTGDTSLGIGIEAGRHDTQDNDFATGINQCLNKDGSNALAGTFNGGNNDMVNIARLAVGHSSPANVVDVQCATSNAVGVVSRGRSGDDISVKLFTNYANSEVARIQCSPTAMELQKSGNNPVVIGTNGVNRIHVTGAGNVGIGQSIPTRPLHIGDGSAATYLRIQGSTSGTAGGSAIEIGTSGNIGNASATFGGTFDNTFMMWANTNPISLYTSGGHRLYVTSAGKVGVGTTTPAATLNVAQNVTLAESALQVEHQFASAQNVAALVVSKFDNTNTTSQVFARFYINNVGTGSGQINANGANACAFGTFSDIRLKENITDLPSQLASIMALRPVEFDYKDGSGHQIGFIAQEVQEIYPDLVGEDKDGMLTLTGLSKNEARMIKAFQEFATATQQKIESLEARIEALEA